MVPNDDTVTENSVNVSSTGNCRDLRNQIQKASSYDETTLTIRWADPVCP